MFDPITLGLTALSVGGSLLSGFGQKQAAAKQGRMQMIADGMAREANERTLAAVNARREELGREMLTVPEERYEKTSQSDDGWVDVDGMMAAAERAGMNPYSFMMAGGLSAYSNRVKNGESYSYVKGHNAEAAYKLMAPEYTLAQASQVPQQHSALSVFGGALTAGAQTFGTQYRANQSYDLQQQKLDLAADSLVNGVSRTILNNNGVSGGTASNARSGATKAMGISDLPYPDKWKYGDEVTVTNPWSRSVIVGNLPDAEVGEKRYGEPGELLFGTRNGINDFTINATGKSLEEWGRATGFNVGDYVQKGDKGWGPAFSRWWNDPKLFPARATPNWVTP